MLAFTHHVQEAGASVRSPLLDFRLWLVAATVWCLIFLRTAYTQHQTARKKAEYKRQQRASRRED